MIAKIGKGKYSEVYTGICTSNDRKLVIKVLKPVKKSKIRREIKILKVLNAAKHPNIVELLDIVQDPASKSYSLVTCYLIEIFEYVDHVDFRGLFPTISDMEIRFYLYELLKVGLKGISRHWTSVIRRALCIGM